MTFDVYEATTAAIVDQLEAGVRPWSKGYDASPAAEPLRHNGIPYRGVNVFLLGIVALTHGYTSPYWMTIRQANLHGARIRKGERGSMVVFSKTVLRHDPDKDEDQAIPVLREYRVWNADQIDGLPPHFYATALRDRETFDPSKEPFGARAFFRIAGARVNHVDRGPPCYIPMLDEIRMPHASMFRHWHEYYSTLAHEHIHWTGHKSRLDRDLGMRFGVEAYGMEELTAELGAAFVCAKLDILNVTREENAAYIGGWLRTLKKDKRAIFTVSSKAQIACDFLCLTAQLDAADEREHDDADVP